MKYTLNQLNVFLKVVEHESVTKAAAELFMTQPAVSIQLRNFQDQFDIPLTEVIRKRLYITDFGKEIALIAERILNEVESINYKTQAYKGVMTGKLRISSVSTGKYVMPYFLSGFAETHEGVDLSLDVTNKQKVIESLVGNEIDFALVSVLPGEVDIEEELLMENKLYMIGGRENQVESKNLIFREPGSATRAAMEDYLHKMGIPTKKRIELTSNEAVKQAVVAGLGHSIMPLIGLRNELLNGDIRIIESNDLPIVTKWRFIWLKDKLLSPVALAFLAYIREHKKEILDTKFRWYERYLH
jgi:DNA-binding transcriptional LysR family regulator